MNFPTGAVLQTTARLCADAGTSRISGGAGTVQALDQL
jgi:hypothetical protein